MTGSYRASERTACAFRGTKARRDDAIFSAFSFGKSEFMLPWRMVRIRARGEKEAEEIFALGGRRNPLERLDSDKEIKGNQSLFL